MESDPFPLKNQNYPQNFFQCEVTRAYLGELNGAQRQLGLPEVALKEHERQSLQDQMSKIESSPFEKGRTFLGPCFAPKFEAEHATRTIFGIK